MPPPRANVILRQHAELWRVTRRILALLAARGVPENEREDLVQEILLARIRAPRVALWTLARNKTADAARAFAGDALGHADRRRRVDDDARLGTLPDPADSLPDPEPDETKMLHVLPLDCLTPVQRRVFVFHLDAGMTFRAIAKSERERWEREDGARADYAMSKTTAEEVYARACERLRALVEGDRRRHRAIVPLWIVDELYEPPAPRPRWWPRALRVLGSAAVAGVAGGFLSGAAFHGCDRRPAPELAWVAVPRADDHPPAPSGAASGVQIVPAALPPVVVADRRVARAPARPRQRAEAVEGDDGRVMQAAGLEEDDPAAALDLLLAVPRANRSPGAVALLARLCSRLRDPRCR